MSGFQEKNKNISVNKFTWSFTEYLRCGSQDAPHICYGNIKNYTAQLFNYIYLQWWREFNFKILSFKSALNKILILAYLLDLLIKKEILYS